MFLADEAGTRERVRRAVSQFGPITAGSLASRLGLTAAAVRRHLDSLAAAGAVEERQTVVSSRGRGRPARHYVLSAEGHEPLVSNYEEIATAALSFVAERAGEPAVRDFVQRFWEPSVSAYAEATSQEHTVEARTAALGEKLTERGFAATVRAMPNGPFQGLQLCQGHCPVLHLARAYPQFCQMEARAFSDLLGVHVQRLATLADGSHVCTTFVPTQVGHITERAR